MELMCITNDIGKKIDNWRNGDASSVIRDGSGHVGRNSICGRAKVAFELLTPLGRYRKLSSPNQVSPRPSYRLLRFLHCESPTLLRSWKSAFKRSEKRAPKTRSGSKRPRTLSSPLDRPKLPGHRGLDQKMKTTSSSRCAGLIYTIIHR